MSTYAEVVASFRPLFGNANHIAASRHIARIAQLQVSLDKYNQQKKKPPKKLIKEMDQLEAVVVRLLKPEAPRVAYTGPEV